MFGRQQSKEPPPATTDKVESVIGPNVVVKGSFICEGSIRIDGTVEGSVDAKGNVIIGDGARVVGDITAHHVSVAGMVKGNITAGGRLEITAKGRVWGDTSAASLAVDEGGILSGRSVLKDAPPPPEMSEGIAVPKKSS